MVSIYILKQTVRFILKGGIEKDLDLLFTRSILVKMLQQPFIVFYFLELFQIRSELERILTIPDYTKTTKEAFRETWKTVVTVEEQ